MGVVAHSAVAQLVAGRRVKEVRLAQPFDGGRLVQVNRPSHGC